MQVETKNASLDTLSVTIQALHVSGKQMTLAVFRQLPMERATNRDGSLAALEFWGLVRYQIKDEASLWAVASADGILYRCKADPEGTSVEAWENCATAAKSELEQYRLWEPMAIAWQAWRDDGHGTRDGKPAPPRPDYNLRHFSVGRDAYYVAACDDADARIVTARRFWQSRATLALLPQLFIAA